MHAQPRPRLLKAGRVGIALAAAFAAASCDLTISGGPGEGEGTVRITVNVTNVGNGSGGVTIAFPAGATVREPCPQVLGPGESCSPFVIVRTAPASMSLEAAPAPGSVFVAWIDQICGGSTAECDATLPPGDDQPTLNLQPRFDLVP